MYNFTRAYDIKIYLDFKVITLYWWGCVSGCNVVAGEGTDTNEELSPLCNEEVFVEQSQHWAKLGSELTV